MDSTGYNSLCSLVSPMPRLSPGTSQRVLGSTLKQRERVKSHLRDLKKQTNINDKRLQWYQIMDVRTRLCCQMMNTAAKLLRAGVFSTFFFFPPEHLSQLKTTFVKWKKEADLFSWSLLFTHLWWAFHCFQQNILTYESSAKYQNTFKSRNPLLTRQANWETQNLEFWSLSLGNKTTIIIVSQTPQKEKTAKTVHAIVQSVWDRYFFFFF